MFLTEPWKYIGENVIACAEFWINC